MTGSSCPVVVQTDAGMFVTKLRGAAQGPGALAAEIVVASLAAVLDLPVPEQRIVHLDGAVASDDRGDELRDLLLASEGANLGFRRLDRAAVMRSDQRGRIDDQLAARALWLDGLVMNADRTVRNPNVLLRGGEVWLIDHGAALGFMHGWDLTEEGPRQAYDVEHHLFAEQRDLLALIDEELAARVSRDAIRRAVARVPDSMLPCQPPWTATHARDAIVAFLWKRLRPPRPFVA